MNRSPNESIQGQVRGYALAIAAMAFAVLLRRLLAPWLGGSLPYVTLFGAVLVATYVAGYRAAILATLLGYVAAFTMFVDPTLAVTPSRNPVGVLLFFATCSVLIALTHGLRTAQRSAHDRWEELRVTLASIGDGVITADADGRVVSLNAVAETLTGWTNAEAKGEPLDRVFHIVNEATRQPVANPATRAIAEGRVVGLANHTILIARDGTERPIDDSAAPIQDAHGRTVGCVLVFRDVGGKRGSELALQRSEHELREFFENASVGLHWVGPDGTILRVNQAELDMLGYTREEYVGRNIAEFHVDPSTIEEVLARLQAGEVLLECPARLRHKDGSIRHVLINSNVLRDGDRFVHTRCFTLDVTERVLAEASLRESRDVLALAMRGGRMGAWSRDIATNRVWWSRELEELFGLPPGGFEGTENGFFEFVHDDDRELVAAAVEAAIRERTDYVVEFRIRRGSSGEWAWMEGRGRAVYGADGAPIMLFGLGVDVTERKRVEQALKDEHRRKDVFLATLSHELRNPLAPIQNALEFQGSPTASAEDLARSRLIIERQLRHLTRLVDDLLDASRITANKLTLRHEDVDLASVLDSALETSRPLLDAAGHTLTVTMPSEPIRLAADPLRLSQVVSNLLNNAARYTPASGHVWLAAARDGAEAVVTVRDDGAGIAADMLEHLFEPFSQAGSSVESQSGLGIGLSLARSLVQLHGGTISASSPGPGRGSEFTVRLPIGAPVEPRSVASNGRPATSGPSRRVLVADDLRDAADSLAMLLTVMGHEVETAYDGEAAFAAAERVRPDVALLDIGMPLLNGYETARRIRGQAWGHSIHLVALTGWGNEEDRRRAVEAGFDAHLVKPVTPEALRDLLAGMPATTRPTPA